LKARSSFSSRTRKWWCARAKSFAYLPMFPMKWKHLRIPSRLTSSIRRGRTGLTAMTRISGLDLRGQRFGGPESSRAGHPYTIGFGMSWFKREENEDSGAGNGQTPGNGSDGGGKNVRTEGLWVNCPGCCHRIY